uniref:intramembrane prenyl-peptidase Rce1 n=1 Tax=Eutreptiella gymnastica TaxID=73025 RepID=A0A7S1N1P2_9EUGL
MWDVPYKVQLTSIWFGVALAVMVTGSFVITMWLFRGATQASRDEPKTIRRRFASTILVSAVSMWAVVFVQPNDTVSRLQHATEVATPLRRLGLVFAPYMLDVAYTMCLNSCLFLGPLVLLCCEGWARRQRDVGRAGAATRDADNVDNQAACVSQSGSLLTTKGQAAENDGRQLLKLLRTYVVGPVTEEVVYRSAACYFLYFSGMSHTGTFLTSSGLFSLAHAHHLFELMYQEGIPLQQALFPVMFQMTFTFIFGMYGCYIYMGTGSLLCAVLLHTYCNWLGPPDFSFLGEPHAALVGTAYIVGLAAFWCIFFRFDLGLWSGSIFYLQ